MPIQKHKRVNSRLVMLIVYIILMVWFVFDGFLGRGPLVGTVFDGGGLYSGLSATESEIASTGVRQDANLFITVAEFINYVLPYAGVLTALSFIASGFIAILGFGSDSAVQRARTIAIWSAVGLIVIIFAFPLTRFILQFAE